MWYVYILKSKKSGKRYIGCSDNPDRRLGEHNAGYNESTRSGVPWEKIYTEKFQDQHAAFLREKELKSYKGGGALKKLLSTGGGVVNRNRL